MEILHLLNTCYLLNLLARFMVKICPSTGFVCRAERKPENLAWVNLFPGAGYCYQD